MDDSGDLKQEEFIPQSQQHGELNILLSGLFYRLRNVSETLCFLRTFLRLFVKMILPCLYNSAYTIE